MPPGFHMLDNGDIICLYEPYPTIVDGYVQNKQFKNTWHPLWEPCKYRTSQLRRCPNNNLRAHTICKLDDTTTNYLKCSGCILLEPPEVPAQATFKTTNGGMMKFGNNNFHQLDETTIVCIDESGLPETVEGYTRDEVFHNTFRKINPSDVASAVAKPGDRTITPKADGLGNASPGTVGVGQ